MIVFEIFQLLVHVLFKGRLERHYVESLGV